MKKPIYKKWWFWLIIVIIVIIAMPLDSDVSDENITASTTTKSTTTTKPTTTTTTTTAKNQGSEDVTSNMTDWEILTLHEHPTFWSNLSEAETFWANVDDSKIGMDGENYKKTNIIYIDSTFNLKIENIVIYLCNSSELNNLTIEEVLPIIKSYIPIAMMNERYECDESFIAQPKDSSENTYYFVCYTIIDKLDEYTDYFYTAFVEIKIVDNYVHHFRIVSGRKPNWASKLEFNGYNKINWDYDFLK